MQPLGLPVGKRSLGCSWAPTPDSRPWNRYHSHGPLWATCWLVLDWNHSSRYRLNRARVLVFISWACGFPLGAQACAFQGISQGVAPIRLALGYQFFFFQCGYDARQREGLRFDKGDGAFLCSKGEFVPSQAGQFVKLGRSPTGLANTRMKRAGRASKEVRFFTRRSSSGISAGVTSLRRTIFGMHVFFSEKISNTKFCRSLASFA
jgi:hypothetical protein